MFNKVSYEIIRYKEELMDMSFFKKLTETVSKGVTTATEKAQQTVEITRLNAQMSGKRKEIEKLFANIGESVYEAYLAQDLSMAESKVIPGSEEISAIRVEITSLDDRIKAIRNEKECVCGKRMPIDTRFCPSCGHPFPDPVPEVIEEETPIQEETPSSVTADQRQICKSCGTPLFADSHYCPTCGEPTR
jgi:rRNA maturation endonuclease Nob1